MVGSRRDPDFSHEWYGVFVMEDRELLELAAKASGNTVYSAGGLCVRPVMHWNPLEDDGDALRLAVKLKLDIAIDDYAQVSWWSEPGSLHWVNENCCRRAIVRAAAEIGKAMP